MLFVESDCTPHCKLCTTAGKCDSGQCDEKYVLDSATKHCEGECFHEYLVNLVYVTTTFRE